MAKRPFSEISLENEHCAIDQIVRHAEELLRSAQILRQDIRGGKHPKQDDVNQLKSITHKISSELETIHNDSGRSRNPASKLSSSNTTATKLPTAVTLGPWTPQDMMSSQPALPAIHNPGLERLVFTHAGIVINPADSYERLEWLGDAYLYLMASAFIYQTFPQLSAGRCSQYRELLVRNKTLARYSQEYQLERKLRLPPEFLGENVASVATNKQYKKVLGDLFEAYVAGVVLGDPEQGLLRAASWVKTLWTKELTEELNKEFQSRALVPTTAIQVPAVQGVGLQIVAASTTSTTPQSSASQSAPQMNAKVRLAQAIGGKGIKIDYRDEGEPKKEKKTGLPWYTVGVYLDGWGVRGFKMGYGSALNKKEAGAKAAQAALDNKKMLSRFEQRKKDFDAAVKAQQDSTA